MKNSILCFLVSVCFSFYSLAFAAESKDDSTLPELMLVVPENETHRTYLGLTKDAGEQFSMTDIDADILVVELFSMYCPFCQKEAPLVNELHHLMNEGENKGLKIKIIGLGASNSQFEVEHFASTYGVNFPLFPDKDMSMYKALGGEGTPGFVAFKLKDSNPPVNVLRNSGGFYSAEDFLLEMIKNSGL